MPDPRTPQPERNLTLEELLSRLTMAQQLEPGSGERASATTAVLLEVIELRRNTPEPTIAQFDDAIAHISEIWMYSAIAFAEEAVRRASKHMLEFAVAALFMDRGASDPRDLVTAIVLVANSADLLHISPESAITKVDTRACRGEDEDTIRAVFRKPCDARRVSSYDYCAEFSGREFRYRKLPHQTFRWLKRPSRPSQS